MSADKARILVVDDDPANLDILVNTLQQEFLLVTARNGYRALELALASPPDLVLLDIILPQGPDGFEVCRCLKAHDALRGIPVIFLSVMEEPGQKQEGFNAGGVDYVTKPFQATEVLARVRTHVTIKRLREELEKHSSSMGRELHETSRQLQTLMNNLPGMVYRGRADAQRSVSFVSEGAQRLTGYAPEHILDTGLTALVHPDDRESLLHHLGEALRSRQRFELTYRMRTPEGHERWVCELGSGVETADGPAVEGFISDITERQKREHIMRRENQALRERLKARFAGELVGESPPMQQVFDLIARAATVDDNVVIYGESGTGKELAARAIHQSSARCQRPFVAVNCGAIPETLFESEFFGFKKGAFTGAGCDKAGFLDQADGGTLFLDEVGEISLMGQVKLLRAIEGSGFIPVGGTKPHKPNVRIIAATNRDLGERVASGAMRNDFYYRIHIIPIHMPPLRQRKSDIPLLVEHCVRFYPHEKKELGMNGALLQACMQYDWPGNVRELQNVLYQYLSLGSSRLGQTVIGQDATAQPAPPAPSAPSAPSALDEGGGAEVVRELDRAVAGFERSYILDVLRRHGWKRNPTAETLGIDRRTLFRKIKEYGLEEEERQDALAPGA